MFTIPGSTYRKFLEQKLIKDIAHPTVRTGQFAYNWFKLEKLSNTEDKIWADKLYETTQQETIKMLESVVDWNQ